MASRLTNAGGPTPGRAPRHHTTPAASPPSNAPSADSVEHAADMGLRPQPPRCPLLRAAMRTADPAVILAVVRSHPDNHCPVSRRAA